MGHLRGVPETGGNGDATVSGARPSQLATGLPNDTEKDRREFAIGWDSTVTAIRKRFGLEEGLSKRPPFPSPSREREKKKEKKSGKIGNSNVDNVDCLR